MFLVDNAELEVAFENVDKARLVPDWVALGLAPQPKKGAAAKERARQTECKEVCAVKKTAKKKPARKAASDKAGPKQAGQQKPNQPAAKRPRAE